MQADRAGSEELLQKRNFFLFQATCKTSKAKSTYSAVTANLGMYHGTIVIVRKIRSIYDKANLSHAEEVELRQVTSVLVKDILLVRIYHIFFHGIMVCVDHNKVHASVQ